MKSINLVFCRCEPRAFKRNIELAFFNQQGSFRIAFYFHLPFYWYSRKALRRDSGALALYKEGEKDGS